MGPSMDYICNCSQEVIKVGDSKLIGQCMWTSDIERESDPIEEIDSELQLNNISSILSNTTGFFTIITRTHSGLAIATDVVSSIPVFYTIENGICYVSDDQQYILNKKTNVSLNPTSIAEYRACSYVTGNKTLVNDIYQTEGASVVEISDEIRTQRYFECKFDGDRICTSDDYEDVLSSVFSNLEEYAAGRPIWIALSGGYDSRLIALELKRRGYDPLYAYSYGLKGNIDSSISKKIANKLGIDWHYIEYSPEKWKQWYQCNERKQLDEKVWLNSTVPLADWPAVYELCKEEIIQDDAIIMTGMTGDVLSGSHIPEDLIYESNVSENQFQDIILKKHYYRNDYDSSQEPSIRKRISNTASFSGGTGKEAIAHTDKWDLLERQSKHISQAVLTFDACDIDWWLPLFDKEHVEFWTQVNLSQRIGQKMYKDYVDDLYKEVTGSHPPIQAKRTSSTGGQLLNTVKKAVENTLIDEYLRDIYKKHIRSTRSSYDGANADPRGILTVMEYERFKELHNGDIGLASYRARELLGEIKLQEDDWSPPINQIRN